MMTEATVHSRTERCRQRNAGFTAYLLGFEASRTTSNCRLGVACILVIAQDVETGAVLKGSEDSTCTSQVQVETSRTTLASGLCKAS
eukprot:5518388-Pleurochrysis_carterae.AAC.3